MTRAEILAKRLIEDEPPAGTPPTDVKDALDQLMPTETLRLGGNDFINAPGLIHLAIREYNLGGRNVKGKKWALGVVRAWPIPPEKVMKILTDPRTTVEANGVHAIVTLHNYDEPPRNRKSSQRPPVQ